MPVYAILLACLVQIALNSIYFGTLTGFNTVISIATEGFCTFLAPGTAKWILNELTVLLDLSYAMPLLSRIIAYFSGHLRVIPGPYTLGRFSVWLNVLGLLFLVFTSITFNFPTVNPVTKTT